MNPYILIISDIHLKPSSKHPINKAFLKFLIEEAPQAEALYILGDLFDTWIGDDLDLPQHLDIIKQLKQLGLQGLPIYLQFGNRDFLMRKSFWKATGIGFLKEPYLLELYGQNYLFLHGDSLCTHDKPYQRMRHILRSPIFSWIFLRLSHKNRLFVSNKLRVYSKKYSRHKVAKMMNVNQQSVVQLLKKYPTVKYLVHGHTHHPAAHRLKIGNANITRWVLGDWRLTDGVHATILKIFEQGPELIEYRQGNKP